MESQEGLDRLFFELASESRLGILRALQENDLRMLEIARCLNLTDTETCRQLQRLSDARLVQKQADGTYRITTYAKIVLSTSSHLDFIFKHREYFLEHDSSFLPVEYRARFGELSGGKLTPTTMETLNKVTVMLRNAQNRIDGTIEVGFDLHLQIMRQRLLEGVKVRWLIQESFLNTAKSMLSSTEKLPEIRSTPRIFWHLYQTEKAAAFCLRQNDGTMSYSAFFGEDASFLKWANDLYTYDWEKAKPIRLR